MNNVEIKCLIEGSLSRIPCKVSVYDSNKNLIFKNNTNKFGILSFTPKSLGIYYIIIEHDKSYLYPRKICKCYYFNGLNDTIPFIFFTFMHNFHHTITFKLTDKHYKNLPVEKGEIKIWNI